MPDKKNIIKLLLIILVVVLTIIFFLLERNVVGEDNLAEDSQINAGTIAQNLDRNIDNQMIIDETNYEIVAENLVVPWKISFLPTGEIIFTQRSGKLVILRDEKVEIDVEGVYEFGEGGLMGLALHPDFLNNNWIYLYFTEGNDDDVSNKVVRYELNDDSLNNSLVIIDGIDGSQFHNGGEIDFGPDGYLYVSTGDTSEESLAQNLDSLNGKILRLDENGHSPNDNPFGNPIYSYGHRNIQGLAWDSQGKLWSTEHGPSGLQSGHDELNLIEIGKNYGWPEFKGDEGDENVETPIIDSGAFETWAPAGIAILGDQIFFSGLRGASLYHFNSNNGVLRTYFNGHFGRIRAVSLGPDDNLYVSTSNRDGRGEVREGDDKIIRINLPKQN